MKRLLLLSLFASLTAANADPLITSWYTDISTKYARIYTSAANRTNGLSVATWTGTQSQTSPAYAGVNEINSSATWVYVRSTGLGGHVMGPWSNPNLPKNQSILWRFARTPTVPGSNRVASALTSVGSIGFMVDGVAAYNTSDGFSYSFANSTDASPTAGIGAGDGIWNRDAFPNESVSFDYALAHNQPSGEYHYHINPISTRYLVGDNITYDASNGQTTSKQYKENLATTNFQHSPIIGWMKDGLPLYGPYGYDGGSTGATATATRSGTAVSAVNVTAGGALYQSVPLVTFSGGGGSGAAATAVLTGGVVTAVNVTSGGTGYTSTPTVTIGGVRRMISGYQLRDGTNGSANLSAINVAVSTTTGRTSLPVWALASQNRAQLSTASQYGPAVNATYAFGHYVEDYAYLGDSADFGGAVYVQGSRSNAGGVFFDLNEYNTRFCVTPEYPNGTWAYFTTITADGTSFYPYGVGRWYRGTPGGGSTTAAVMNADTPLTQQFLGGANTPIAINTPSVSSPTVSLTWTSVEGGTYSVDASTNQSSWTSKQTGLTPSVPTAPIVGNAKATTSASYTTLGTSGTEYARASRTALATYDPAGQTASTVSQSAIASYNAAGIPNTPPTITTPSAQSTPMNTATGAIAFTVGDAETAAASLTVSGSSANTVLVPNANLSFGGSGAGRTVTVTPAQSQTGSAVITISVNDGTVTTSTTFTLTVTGTNTAPTIGAISSQSTPQNTATSAIAFTVGDADTGAASLTLSGTSGNTTLVPNANIVFGGSGASRTVTITPASGQTGSALITITVSDGAATAQTTFTLTVTASSPTITNITTTPAVPTNADTATVTANIAPPAGRTISTAQLTYNTGSGATVVFNETMGTAATTAWTGAGTVFAWTTTFVGAPTAFRQSAAGNHTAVGGGNQFGFETIGCSPTIGNNTITTTNNINATGTSGTVEFYVSVANMTGAQGWDFQTSIDGANWTSRITETNIAADYGFTIKSYTLSAAERVSTLKLRFRFAGGGMNMAPAIRLDDIKVTIGGASSPVSVSMFDDGAHGDGAAGDGVYGTGSQAGQFIPVQTTGTTVSYSIAATDSAAATTTSATNSYTVVAANPVLTVTPAGGLTSSGNPGGAFSPASATYTLSNTGTGPMNWTASKTAAWLTLSSGGGTLAAGAGTTVTASFNAAANSLAAGGYSDTVTFTNGTNGNGNTTRAVSLTVNSNTVPATPVLVAQPAFTQGTSKTIAWTAAAGATGYTLEVSTAANFGTVLASQAVTSPTASFSNLASGVTYYYRVKATNGIGSSLYSNVVSSLQDSVAPVVAVTSPASAQSTATATFTVSGTSSDEVNGSGISKVTVNGVTATTTNGFATWTISVPLGYGTNGITAVAYDNAGNVTTTAPVNVTLTVAQTFNPLIIPEVLTGTTFNLNLHQTSKRFGNATFQNTANTTTYAYNNMLMWGPTLIMNKGDWVQMNVTNSLTDTTTTHWHGFHIPAIMDGGPHQTIPAGTTWMPSFYVANNAGTYWYHPHLHEFTQEQLTHGGGGMIIIRDPIESALNLPRTYGVDDFPLALTSRRFANNQFVTTGIAYGDYAFVNGTLSPQVTLPKQYVRLRILNAEIERSYNLGFSDGRTFYQIATDGGLVNAPVALTRIVLAVGERAEILVDLSGDTVGSSFDLQAFNSGQAADFPGGEAQTTGPVGSLLNNTTFNVLRINVGAATANPILTRPATLTTNTFYAQADVTNTRTLTITGGIAGTPFGFDNLVYSPTVLNQTLNLNAVERWDITNNSGFSHSFHIHDIQFHILSRTGGNNAGVKTFEEGWKDVVFIARNQTVSFIAKFDGFASETNPFMYHCHFSNHEDDGLMGQFVVRNNAVEALAVSSFTRTGDRSLIQLDFKATPGTTYTLQYLSDLTTGTWSNIGSVTSDGSSATFIETDPTRLGQARGFYRVTIPTVP